MDCQNFSATSCDHLKSNLGEEKVWNPIICSALTYREYRRCLVSVTKKKLSPVENREVWVKAVPARKNSIGGCWYSGFVLYERYIVIKRLEGGKWGCLQPNSSAQLLLLPNKSMLILIVQSVQGELPHEAPNTFLFCQISNLNLILAIKLLNRNRKHSKMITKIFKWAASVSI